MVDSCPLMVDGSAVRARARQRERSRHDQDDPAAGAQRAVRPRPTRPSARPAHRAGDRLTCLDHRVDPAITLGLKLGDAPVIRNAGGRVTEAVIEDIAYLAFLAEQVSAGQVDDDRLFEVAIIHHTQCGTSFLADPGFRRRRPRRPAWPRPPWKPKR